MNELHISPLNHFLAPPSQTDTEMPIILGCPHNITSSVYAHRLHVDGLAVVWTEPVAVDNSEQVTTSSSHRPGSKFRAGSTLVTYEFSDPSNNTAICSFSVIVHVMSEYTFKVLG